jgi:hypothetical protein
VRNRRARRWPAAALLLVVPPGAANAGAVRYEAEWLALASTAPARTVPLQEKKSEPFVQIVPRTAFRLTRPALDQSGKVVVPEGTVFTGVKRRPDTRCEVLRRPHQVRPFCLVDGDGDGRFDGSTSVWADEVFFAGFAPGKAKPLRAPVAFAVIDPRTEAPQFVVEVYFANRAELVGRNDLNICVVRGGLKSWWGASTSVRMCLPQLIDLGNKDYPRTVSLYGGSLTFLSREDNRVQVKVMPPRTDFAF